MKRIKINYIWLGIVFGIICLAFEFLLHAFIFKTRFLSDTHDIWIHSLTFLLFVVLGIVIETLNKKRRKIENRNEHLNLVLKAIRKVVKLITQIKDKGKLIDEVCKSLTETRGYKSAWIFLFDDDYKLKLYAQSNAGEGFDSLQKQVAKDKFNKCIQKALRHSDVILIENPQEECEDCPVKGKNPQERTMTVRLEHKKRIYGILSVSIPAHFSSDKEEAELFKEVANDIAFSLYTIEIEEKEKKAMQIIKKSEEKYRSIFDNAPVGIFTSTLEGELVSANLKLAKMLGCESIEEALSLYNDLRAQLYHNPKKRDKLISTLKEKQKLDNFEFKIKQKDGKNIWVSLNAKLVKGASSFIEGFVRDITDRKRSQK